MRGLVLKMKGGNEESEANGITQFAEGEPKSRMCSYQNDAAENLSGSRTKSAKEISRKVREVRKEILITKNT